MIITIIMIIFSLIGLCLIVAKYEQHRILRILHNSPIGYIAISKIESKITGESELDILLRLKDK